MPDTMALIEYYHGRSGVIAYLEAILAGRDTGAFSTITELELWQGIRPGEQEGHEVLLALLERIPLDGAIARWAGQLYQQIGLDRLSLPDAAIVASAQLSGCTLLTRNTRDFQPLHTLLAVEFYRCRGVISSWMTQLLLPLVSHRDQGNAHRQIATPIHLHPPSLLELSLHPLSGLRLEDEAAQTPVVHPRRPDVAYRAQQDQSLLC
jgi:predicted nucleic acid-binding protein